jgi:NitT/TauT family transport system substrate-binding protein
MQRVMPLVAALVLALLSLPPAASAQNAPIKLGVGHVEANAQVFYAEALGLFQKHGLDVQVVQLRSGPAQAAAVASGDLQIGIGNLVSLASAHVHNLPFTLVAPGALYDASAVTMACVAAPSSTIHDAKELGGKTVTGISVGGLDQLALDAWIDKAGGDFASVHYIETPPSAMVAAVDTGRVAVAALNDPELSVALDAKQAKVVANCYSAIAPVFMQTAFFATKDWAAKHPDQLRRFSDAVVEAGEWAAKHPDEARAILQKQMKTNVAATRVRFATRLDPALIQPLLDSATRYKVVAAPVSASDLIWNGRSS